MEEDLVTTTELCDWLRVNRSTVSRWRQKGLPFTGTGKALRYRRSEVQNWLDDQNNKSQESTK